MASTLMSSMKFATPRTCGGGERSDRGSRPLARPPPTCRSKHYGTLPDHSFPTHMSLPRKQGINCFTISSIFHS